MKFFKHLLGEMKNAISDPNAIVADIHNEFDSATDRLLAEASENLSQSNADIRDRASRLMKLGFFRSKEALEGESLVDKEISLKEDIKWTTYCQQYYPNYKYITEREIERICKKYGLVYGYVYHYIGSIPEKNLREIEGFNLRDEDKIRHRCGYFTNDYHGRMLVEAPSNDSKTGRYGYITERGGVQRLNEVDTSVKFGLETPSLKICASVKDFAAEGLQVVDGYKLSYIPDPVVIQPVKRGGLILSKWGVEGKDNDLTNEKMN